MSAITAIPQEPGSMSPSSSPRLPSPPPFPEVQTAPKSPLDDDVPQLPSLPNGVSRRIRPGTKAVDMSKGPPLVPLSELNSPFQLQEYLKALHHKETHDSEGNTRSLDRAAAVRLATAPEGVERSLWLYELCRLLIARVNPMIVGFFGDTPKCNAQNCPEMRASEWQYLCAVHDPPKSCCAIDYCCHTLDWASNIITSPKHFPSRLTLGGDGGASQQGIRQLTNIFRRVYRMFAHAWYQHREVFWRIEGEEGLYLLYKTVCDVYSLMPADTYTVPPEAEGIHGHEESAGRSKEQEAKHETPTQGATPQDLPFRPKIDREGTVINLNKGGASGNALTTATATKRHKHTPSTGSFVSTITEGDEESEHRGTTKPESASSEDAAGLSTVRYDPKDLQLAPPPEDSADDIDDGASEVTMIIDPPPEETEVAEEASNKLSKSNTAVEAGKLDEDAKSPITPIEDEPSPETASAPEIPAADKQADPDEEPSKSAAAPVAAEDSTAETEKEAEKPASDEKETATEEKDEKDEKAAS